MRFGAMRRRFDPQADLGVPAHITVLFPFMPPELIDTNVCQRLRRLFGQLSPVQFQLERVGRFPLTTYLAPEPTDSLVELTNAVVEDFPEYPPYGGAYASVIPHLTIADGQVEIANLAEIELRNSLNLHGPVRAHCNFVSLLENSSGRWRVMHEFALGEQEG